MLSLEPLLPDMGPADKEFWRGNAMLAPSLFPSYPRPMLDCFERMTGDIPSLKLLGMPFGLESVAKIFSLFSYSIKISCSILAVNRARMLGLISSMISWFWKNLRWG